MKINYQGEVYQFENVPTGTLPGPISKMAGRYYILGAIRLMRLSYAPSIVMSI